MGRDRPGRSESAHSRPSPSHQRTCHRPNDPKAMPEVPEKGLVTMLPELRSGWPARPGATSSGCNLCLVCYARSAGSSLSIPRQLRALGQRPSAHTTPRLGPSHTRRPEHVSDGAREAS